MKRGRTSVVAAVGLTVDDSALFSRRQIIDSLVLLRPLRKSHDAVNF